MDKLILPRLTIIAIVTALLCRVCGGKIPVPQFYDPGLRGWVCRVCYGSYSQRPAKFESYRGPMVQA